MMNKTIKFKLLSIDLDGTLLNPIKRIAKPDLKALKNYNDQGGIIFINTGKNLRPTLKIVHKLNKILTNKIRYFSCLNGNIVYDVLENKIIYETSLDITDVIDIIEITKQAYVNYSYYLNVRNQIKRVFNYWNANLTNPIVYKLNILSWITDLCKNQYLIQELAKLDNIEVARINEQLYEVMKKDCNKAASLKFITKLLNIKINDVAAIGDSENDLSMLSINDHGFLVRKTKSELLNEKVKHKLDLKKHKVAYVINHHVL